jgi:membrane protein
VFKKIGLFFEKEMWQTPYSSLKGIKGFFSKTVRISYLTIRSFTQDQCMMRAASLTYYSVMALVPALALAFSIAQGLKVKQYLEAQLYQRFSEQKEILDILFTFANNLLDKAKGSVLAVFGLLFIFWALIKMLSHLENALNTVWQIQTKRSVFKRIRDYFSIMILGPIFFLLSLSATFFIVSWVEEIIGGIPIASAINPGVIFLLKMAPYGVIWLLFILLYFVLPSKRVPIKPTLIGALIGGTVYQVVQWTFVVFQIGVTRSSAIYGSFVFLPLFLIWMHLSWTIFLAGAEIGFSISHVKTYELEKQKESLSFNTKKLLSLWILIHSIEEFAQTRFLTKEKIQNTFSLSSGIIDHILKDLLDLGLIIKTVKKDIKGYIPAGFYDTLTLVDVFNLLEKSKESSLSRESLYQSLEEDLQSFNQEIKNLPSNKKISDLYTIDKN